MTTTNATVPRSRNAELARNVLRVGVAASAAIIGARCVSTSIARSFVTSKTVEATASTLCKTLDNK
jgi:hypothetical protein